MINLNEQKNVLKKLADKLEAVCNKRKSVDALTKAMSSTRVFLGIGLNDDSVEQLEKAVGSLDAIDKLLSDKDTMSLTSDIRNACNLQIKLIRDDHDQYLEEKRAKDLSYHKNEAIRELRAAMKNKDTSAIDESIATDMITIVNFGFRYNSQSMLHEACGGLNVLNLYSDHKDVKKIYAELHSLCSLKLTELKKG